ncbi:hypothetical protein PTKIN_Ptkin13bG0304700 [Pterospermum kingtungense]
MPLTRYQIRNEYSLADPELYRASDKDDPEALLEGVTMSALVGLLRQLGDLAQFAAEIFHDLHEDVMATAARGHGLMVRVQQLEAEFPSIEKAFLSQTNQSLFFTNAGADWHPNLRTQHNLITRGDLPRCVRDSYEECRGPPRLFLLDKFDVAGAGACLKRYTDPSFFKAESAFPGIEPFEVQREKKPRKVKKKGSRWRNGGTPEFAMTSHAQLHQLFLEERLENAYNDPARLVKLKRRQLNESPLDSKSRKSYMEKFLETPSSEHKVVYETSDTLPPLRLTLDNSSESGVEIHEIRTVSPVKNSLQGKEISSSPAGQEIVLKPSMEELNGEVIDREVVKVPEPKANFTEGVPPTLPKVAIEKEITVDGEGRKECSTDGDHSDDMISEVENYMDALTIMESEMDTDIEYRPKNDIGFINIGKYPTGSDANEEKLEVQAFSSDSQSVGITSPSNEGDSSFKKGRSSFSYSDTIDNLAEDMLSDDELAAKMFPSNKNHVSEIVEATAIQLPASLEMQCFSSDKVLLPEDTLFGAPRHPDLGEESYSSGLEDLSSSHILLDQASSMAYSSLESERREITSDGKTNPDLSDSVGGKCVSDSLEKQELTLMTLSAEIHVVKPDVNAVTLEAGHNSECRTPMVDNSQAFDSTDIGASYSEQKQNVAEVFDAANGVETRDMCSLNVVEGDALSCDLPCHGADNLDLKDHVGLDDLATENVHADGIAVSTLASSEFSDKESESKYSSHLMESRADMLSSPTPYLSENETSLEWSLDIHASQHDVGSLYLVEDSSNSLNLLSNQIQSLDHMDQENCLQTSFEHSREGSSSHPSSEFTQQSVRQDKQESYPSGLIDPASGPFPEAAKISREVMPPLPPLPPMQWRIGRLQHVSSASERELVEHSQVSFPMIPQYGTDEKAQFGEEPRNLFLPLMDGEERSGHVSDHLVTDFMQHSPFSMHATTMGSHANSQYNDIFLDRTHSNPFLTLPTISNENLRYGSIVMDGDSKESSDIDATSRQIPVSLPEKTTHPPNQFVLDAGLGGGTFQHPNHISEEEHGHSPDMHVPQSTRREEQIPTKVVEDLPIKVEEQFLTKLEEQLQHGLAASDGETAQIPNANVQHGLAAPGGETAQVANTTLQIDLSTSEGEAAWPSNTLALLPVAEDGNSNGNPTVKLPRPRNPLIDAVAAHDKSKLRKVTEQIRPPIIPKVDERDSLLEQIRTKSFNLKPAVVSRPSVQGPRTNLRVAAILEKANAIRQALAGSDEDEDEDGWSDS